MPSNATTPAERLMALRGADLRYLCHFALAKPRAG